MTRMILKIQPNCREAILLKVLLIVFLAFEIVLNFLRCGARKIPPNTNVCTESIGHTAEVLGILAK